VSASNYHHIDGCTILRETEKAFLVRLPEDLGGDEEWIPLSQIADAEEYAVGDEDVTLSVREWLARERGWM
jgi:hypothetical protein